MKFPDYKKLMEQGVRKDPTRAIVGTPSFCTTMLKEAYPQYYFGRTSKNGVERAKSQGYAPLDITFFGDKISLTEFNENAALRFDLYVDKTLGLCCNRDAVIIAMTQEYRDFCIEQGDEQMTAEHNKRMQLLDKDPDKPFKTTTEKLTASQLDGG